MSSLLGFVRVFDWRHPTTEDMTYGIPMTLGISVFASFALVGCSGRSARPAKPCACHLGRDSHDDLRPVRLPNLKSLTLLNVAISNQGLRKVSAWSHVERLCTIKCALAYRQLRCASGANGLPEHTHLSGNPNR